MGEIRIEGLTKVYSGNVTALDRLDLTINDGEFFALLGPSGCGKTTLLRTIAGRSDPHRRARRHEDVAGGPRRGHGVPGLRALPAHDGQ